MSSVLETLTEEESYLWAILSDQSGLDQAEFSLIDLENEDLCFRAWPFQWPWWRDMSQQQIDLAARSVGKSKSIMVRAYAFPFVHPGGEMVITAPEGVHLDAITDVVETAFMNNRLGREMLINGRTGIKHRPFHMNFWNGARIMGRIPQRDGKGMKGTHPIWLEMDESQDYPPKGWKEIIETLKFGSTNSRWRSHGVTRGLRDDFWEMTQPDSGWRVHRLVAMHRPNWTDEERQKKIKLYGSKDHPDYKRNVLGLHGDASNAMFVLHRLMACVDTEAGSNYNQYEYVDMRITNEDVLRNGDNILPLLDDLPATHTKYARTWIGMDVGYTYAPSAIVVFAEEKLRGEDEPRLKLLAKIMLERISNPHQVAAILKLISFYKPQVFALDRTGVGLPLFQELQDKATKDPRLSKVVGDTIRGYNFSEKILVDFDDAIEVSDPRDIEEAGIKRQVLEYSSDKLRQLVDKKRILLPLDKTIINEFQGQTYTYNTAIDMYGRGKSFSKGEFHVLDATRMAILGYVQFGIELLVKDNKADAVLDVFLF